MRLVLELFNKEDRTRATQSIRASGRNEAALAPVTLQWGALGEQLNEQVEVEKSAGEAVVLDWERTITAAAEKGEEAEPDI